MMPEPIEGTCRAEWVQEGVAVVQTLRSTVGGQTFRSVRLIAFNAMRNRIEAASLEGAGVGIATGVGTISAANGPLHLISRVDEQHAGRQDVPTETNHVIESDGRQSLEIYELSPGGRVHVGTVEYTRTSA